MASPMLTCLLLIYCSILTQSQDLSVIWNSTIISDLDPGTPDPRVVIYHDEINLRTTTGSTPDGDGVLICNYSGAVEWLRPGSSTPVLSSTNDGDFRIIRTRSAGITRSQLARVVQTPVTARNEGLWSCNGGGLPRLYVSLYRRGNGAIMNVAVSLQSSSFESNRFTLAGDTTGGPPKTFSWRRNDGSALTFRFHTVVIPVADPNDNQEDRKNCLYRSFLQVTGMLPGVYEYRASNRATSGDVTGSFTVEGGAPSSLQVAQTGVNMVELTWDPPPGPPARGYRIGDSGSNNIDMTTTSTSLTISSLSPGVYNFIVTSPSQHFPGGMVGPEAVTVRGVFTPVITLSELTATSIRVSWSSPPMFSFNVTRYEVTVRRLTNCISIIDRRGPRNRAANILTELFTDLEEYINYRAEVRVFFQLPISFTVSPVTTVLSFTTPGIAPSGVPSNVRIPTVTSRTANMSWNALDCIHQNGPNFRYEVELQQMDGEFSRVVTVNGGADSTVNDELFAVVNDLQPFTNYTFRVRGVSDVGNGGYTDIQMIQTNEDVPGNVTDLNRLFTSFSSVNITWRPPQEPNGRILAYELTYILNGTTSMSQNFTDPLNFTIDSEFGTEIEVRVRAYTSVGPGLYAIIVITLLPPTVMNVRVESLTDTSVRVTWNQIIIPGITISEYVVYYSPISSNRRRVNQLFLSVPGDENSVEISGLESTVMYRLQVAAVSILGGKLLEGARSPETRFKITEPGDSGAFGDCAVTAAVSVIATFLLSIILYSALLLVGFCITRAYRSNSSKNITDKTDGMAMKENAAYGPVTSSQQPHDHIIYAQPDVKNESEYDVVS